MIYAMKKEVVRHIKIEVERWKDRHMPNLDLSMGCFYYSAIGAAILKDHYGLAAKVSAGSLSWPRIARELDDGKVDTHFSYMFEPYSPATKLALVENRMPEMHVWITLPEEHEILDLTTGYLKQQCQRRTTMKWMAPDPPEFLWVKWHEIPEDVHYEPSHIAVQIIGKKIMEWVTQ